MRASALALWAIKKGSEKMHKYQIIFMLNNGSSIALPEDNFNLAVKAAKALIKLKVVGVVSIVNTETEGSTTFIDTEK